MCRFTNPLHHTLEQIDFIILLIFTVEIVIKMMKAPKPLNYFKNPWNIFDFVIVAVCWLSHLIPAMDAGFMCSHSIGAGTSGDAPGETC
ncbi:MAG: ion transporter [Saprospiraceae bacterium]